MAAALDVLGVQLAVLDVTVLDSAKAVVIQLVPQVAIVTVRDVLVLVLVVPDALAVQGAALVVRLLARADVLDVLVVVLAVLQHVKVDVLAVQAVAPVVRLLARVDAQVARDADQDVLQHVKVDAQVVQGVVLVAPQHVLEVARELVMDALVAVADIVILDVLIVHKLVIIMLLLQCQRLLKLQKLIN